MVSQKHVFWEALIIAIFIFGVGLLFGFWMENLRTNDIEELYAQSDLDLLDAKLQTDIIGLEISCDKLVKGNIEFADRIYSEALKLDKYESSNKLSDSLIIQHKRYDLLRTLLWMNSIKIKEKCDADYINLVYFYKYKNPGINKKAEQGIFSKVLEKVKERQGDKVLLIPIAVDLDISSLNLLKSQYGITEFPTILINEKMKITELPNADEIESYLNDFWSQIDSNQSNVIRLN